MAPSVRFAVMMGTSLQPVIAWWLFGYQAPLPGYVVMLAPIVAWLGIETAIRVHSPRWIRAVLSIAGLSGAGVWWWWVCQWSAQIDAMHHHHVSATSHYGTPTVLALVMIGGAAISGLMLARRGRRTTQPEPVHH